MNAFDSQLAMNIVSQSYGGFSYDTLARAMISKYNYKDENPSVLLESCRDFCFSLEQKGILKRCQKCASFKSDYFEYIRH